MKFLKIPNVYMLDLLGFEVRLKTPGSLPYFSERNGYWTPKLRLFGYRLFIDRVPKEEING